MILEYGKCAQGKEITLHFISTVLLVENFVVQSLSHVNSATPWIAARQASQSFTISRSLLKLMFIELMMPSKHLIFCGPLLLLPSAFPSIRVFSNESALHIKWPKDWSFSSNINTSNEDSRVDFLYDWLVWSPCSPRDSQESSLAQQFESINSLVLSLLYGPTLASVQDH